MIEIGARNAFRHMQSVAMKGSGSLAGAGSRAKPGFVIETDYIHDEGVAFPVSCRITHPGRIQILGMRASIRGDDAIRGIPFVQDDQLSRDLNEPGWMRATPDAWLAIRQAMQ